MRELGYVFQLCLAKVFGGPLPIPNNAHVEVYVDLEQLPNPKNFFSFRSATKEKVILNWALNKSLDGAVERFVSYLHQEIFSKAGIKVNWYPKSEWKSYRRDCYHPSGGLGISDQPGSGVVDKNLRMHDIHNLFVFSSAVFPSPGSANPTFTLLCLIANVIKKFPKLCQKRP